MTDIILTKPTIGDEETLWRWGEENWELWGSKKNKWFSKKSIHRWIEDPRDDVLLIAREGTKPVGMSITSTMRDWAFCFGFFVEEKYRGKGIGKRLMQESLKQLKSKGITFICLLVDTKNMQAKKFYEREGYTEGYKFYLMEKNI